MSRDALFAQSAREQDEAFFGGEASAEASEDDWEKKSHECG